MEQIKETLNYLNSKTDNFQIEVVVILGSGLSVFCSNIEGIKIPYCDIPHFGKSHVKGHKGELLFCKIEGKNCAIMQGRFHYYEGNTMQECTYPVKILKLMGAKTIFITNAAGAMTKRLSVGDIMMITDHINFMGNNPLIGKNDDSLGERFPDMSNIYSETLRNLAIKTAKELNIDLKEGVYTAVTGPSYETKAEVKMYSTLGGDVVGMSSVPEAIVANYLKMNIAGFSMITNYATGIQDNKLMHEEVLEIGKSTGLKLSLLIKKMISQL